MLVSPTFPVLSLLVQVLRHRFLDVRSGRPTPAKITCADARNSSLCFSEMESDSSEGESGGSANYISSMRVHLNVEHSGQGD